MFKRAENKEEEDGCDHGATGKECREDPSDNGKDCEQHGNHGGVNEDHCVTTTTIPGTTTTTVKATTSSTTTTTLPLTTTVVRIGDAKVVDYPELASTGGGDVVLALGLLLVATGLWLRRLVDRWS